MKLKRFNHIFAFVVLLLTGMVGSGCGDDEFSLRDIEASTNMDDVSYVVNDTTSTGMSEVVAQVFRRHGARPAQSGDEPTIVIRVSLYHVELSSGRNLMATIPFELYQGDLVDGSQFRQSVNQFATDWRKKNKSSLLD